MCETIIQDRHKEKKATKNITVYKCLIAFNPACLGFLPFHRDCGRVYPVHSGEVLSAKDGRLYYEWGFSKFYGASVSHSCGVHVFTKKKEAKKYLQFINSAYISEIN